jgi:hypothetical protein
VRIRVCALVRHLCDIQRHRPEPLMLEFKSGADNATRRGKDWRLFGAYRFETKRHANDRSRTLRQQNPWSWPVFTISTIPPDTMCQGPTWTGGQEVGSSNLPSPTTRKPPYEGLSHRCPQCGGFAVSVEGAPIRVGFRWRVGAGGS